MRPPALLLLALAALSSGCATSVTFKRGLTVNHWLASNFDEQHAYGAPWFDDEDFEWIEAHGFDHVRLRASSRQWLTADGAALDEKKLEPLDKAVGWAGVRGMGLVVAMTAFPLNGTKAQDDKLGDEATVAAAEKVWRLVARRYASVGEWLRFELVHQPNTSSTPEMIAFNRRTLAAVRAESPERFVYLGTPNSDFRRVSEVPLGDDRRVGLAVQYSEPETFTFQIDETKPLVSFPGAEPPLTVASIDDHFSKLAASAGGRELYVAEYGVYRSADDASQKAYLPATRAAIERHGFGWSLYDYETGCAVRGADGMPTVTYEGLGLKPVPAAQRFSVVDDGKPAGTSTLRLEGAYAGARLTLDAEHPRDVAFTLDADGLTRRYSGRPVAKDFPPDDETVTADGATARIRTPGGDESREWKQPSFFVPYHLDPFATWLLAKALLRNSKRSVQLVPEGQATLETLGTLSVGGQTLTQLGIVGLDLGPTVVWVEDQDQLVAVVDDERSGLIAEGKEAHLPALAKAQAAALAKRAEGLAAKAWTRPAKGLLLRHARVFDAEQGTVAPEQSVLMLGGTIAQVGVDGSIAAPPGIDEVDVHGRFVMPGLWDSHAHLFSREKALLQLAAGVTTVRDMGNEGDLPSRVKRYDSGAELGPRALLVVRFGWTLNARIPRVTTEAEATEVLDTYAARGYVQAKALNGLDPALVPAVAKLAHARGLRFSGHVPDKMTAQSFLEAGAEEVHHMPFFFRGKPKELTAEVRGLLGQMAQKGWSLDPTLAQSEPGARGLSPAKLTALEHFPPLARRDVERDPATPEQQEAARKAFPVYAAAVKAAVDLGITVVPGTDTPLPGFLLRRELELYAQAGIPTAKVLQMATLGAAKNMKRDDRSGSIAPGKDADVVVIDGDPLKDLRELAKVTMVIKNGWWVDPAELRRMVSLRPPE